ADGNPFYAHELLRMVVEQGALVRRGDTWVLERPLPESLPGTINEVIASRLTLLSDRERAILQHAAVVGKEFWLGAVEALGSIDALAPIRRLVGRGLIVERERSVIAGEAEFAFNNLLTRDAAYEELGEERRAEAHAKALDWIESVTVARGEEFAEILAHHAER